MKEDIGGWGYFQVFLVYVFQKLHLLNGYPVKADKPFVLRQAIVDENGIQILHIREANQLVDTGIVAHVSFEAGMRVAPFEGGHAKHGYIQHIGFAGINTRGLLRGDFPGDKGLLDGIRVNAVVYLRQFTLGTPAYLGLFLLFEALELFNQIDFKQHADGRSKFKCYIFVGVCSTIFSFSYDNTDGICFSVHSDTLITKLGNPACDLKWSNSTTLKLGL